MNTQGLIIGFAAFIIIGVFHPIVVKAEYHLSKNVWPIFLVVGIMLVTLSFFTSNVIISAILGITGFASLWSIRELFEQEERVRKGWFPENPGKSR